MIIELNSVGSVVDDQTMMVYPKLEDGTIQRGVNGIPLNETIGEWFSSLSNEDIVIVVNLLLKGV